MRMYLDAHCHLQDPRVDAVRVDWLEKARARFITEFVMGGVGPEDWERQERLFAESPGTYFPTIGLHPWWVSERSETAFQIAFLLLKKKLADPKWVALGETGLDHHERFTAGVQALQARAFIAQLDLAAEMERPLVLHVVRAHEETLKYLSEHPSAKGGMVHSFSGPPALARAYLRKGFLPSLSAAVLTRGKGKAFHQLREAVLEMKLSELLLETDAPDQPPADQKGELNPVENLWRVAEIVAQWKQCTPEEVAAASTENWKKKFLKQDYEALVKGRS